MTGNFYSEGKSTKPLPREKLKAVAAQLYFVLDLCIEFVYSLVYFGKQVWIRAFER